MMRAGVRGEEESQQMAGPSLFRDPRSAGRLRLLAWIACLAAAALLAALAPLRTEGAVPAAPEVRVNAVRAGDQYIITAAGTAPAAGAWLGRSLYAYGITNKASQGSHEVVRVASSFLRSWRVPVAWVRNGSYEVALWATKVPASQCTIPNDPWCKRNGFHLAGLLAWRSGWLPR
jgi:hypothetical protein